MSLQLVRTVAISRRLPHEIKAVVKGVNIAGLENTERVRQVTQAKVDELFSLMSRRARLIETEIRERLIFWPFLAIFRTLQM